MAARSEIALRKDALLADLRRASREVVAPASVSISQRDLSARYNLSIRTVSLALQQLVDEGVLYTLPRVGTFLGSPQPKAMETYLFAMPYFTEANGHVSLLKLGFEDRVAQLGGVSITILARDVRQLVQEGAMPPLAGVMAFHPRDLPESLLNSDIPRVGFGDSDEDGYAMDHVNFDNVAGGVTAARHLLQMGHRKIAYFGLHHPNRPGTFIWSRQREEGFRSVLRQAGCELPDSSFYPGRPAGLSDKEQIEPVRESAAALLAHKEFSAVLTANAHTAQGVLQAYREAHIAEKDWPAIVCFDEHPAAAIAVVSYLRLPWDELGREAAQLLWERRVGHCTGAPVTRMAQMRLIPRLSCRPAWASSSGLGAHQAAALTSAAELAV